MGRWDAGCGIPARREWDGVSCNDVKSEEIKVGPKRFDYGDGDDCEIVDRVRTGGQSVVVETWGGEIQRR